MTPIVQRLLAGALLLAAGFVSLPLSAALLDGQGTENWILPAQVAVMVLLGVLVTLVAPALAGAGASRSQRVLIGAGWGLLAACVGVLVFWFLLNGLHGA